MPGRRPERPLHRSGSRPALHGRQRVRAQRNEQERPTESLAGRRAEVLGDQDAAVIGDRHADALFVEALS